MSESAAHPAFECMHGVCMRFSDPGRYFAEASGVVVSPAAAKAAGWDVEFWQRRRKVREIHRRNRMV